MRRLSAPRRFAMKRSITTAIDRKSTRLNSSHGYISYAVFCLKKKKFIRIGTFRAFAGLVPLQVVGVYSKFHVLAFRVEVDCLDDLPLLVFRGRIVSDLRGLSR